MSYNQMMQGKLLTCDCVINVNPGEHTGEYVYQCKEHEEMGYSCNEVLAEHVAIQLDAIKQHKPINRFIKKIKGLV